LLLIVLAVANWTLDARRRFRFGGKPSSIALKTLRRTRFRVVRSNHALPTKSLLLIVLAVADWTLGARRRFLFGGKQSSIARKTEGLTSFARKFTHITICTFQQIRIVCSSIHSDCARFASFAGSSSSALDAGRTPVPFSVISEWTVNTLRGPAAGTKLTRSTQRARSGTIGKSNRARDTRNAERLPSHILLVAYWTVTTAFNAGGTDD
jgi:hypothetical protein